MKKVLLMLPLLAATSLCAQNINELNKADVENAL